MLGCAVHQCQLFLLIRNDGIGTIFGKDQCWGSGRLPEASSRHILGFAGLVQVSSQRPVWSCQGSNN